MKLNYLSQTFLPFLVPQKDATFAANVGPQTVYPAGYSLEKAMQIYWRAKEFRLIATATGATAGLSQSMAIDEIVGPRNAVVGTNLYFEQDGMTQTGPGDLVTGVGLTQTIAGSGTISASDGSTADAVMNLQMNLFYPEIFVPDPVVRYDGKWWPALGIACSAANAVTTGSGGLSMIYACDSYDPASSVEIGAFSFFGVSVPVFCAALTSGETRTFSGSIAVETEWP